jgi:hypothetical protein
LHLHSKGLERILIEGFVLEQQLCRLLKNFVILFQNCAGTAKGILNDRSHRLVDLACCILAISSCWLGNTGKTPRKGEGSSSYETFPSVSSIPNRVTMLRAISVAFLRSYAAPVETSGKQMLSAARPPSNS